MSDTMKAVIESLENKKSFILEAGAGSGKTSTLVRSLKYLISNRQIKYARDSKQIVCITYTNVAKDEIAERIEYHDLVHISTIHDFLWDAISPFQSVLSGEVLWLNGTLKKERQTENLAQILSGVPITYSQYGRKLEKGRITHDDVLSLAKRMFLQYPKITRLVTSKYPVVFVDEYQDTSESTVSILLDSLVENGSPDFMVGFFGDKMQNIYESGVGEITDPRLKTITKTENFRCPTEVIEVLNRLRNDFAQVPGLEDHPKGTREFIIDGSQGSPVETYDKTIQYLSNQKGWDFDSNETKILMLTHRYIAGKAGYQNLLAAFDKLPFGRDDLFSLEQPLADLFVNKIEALVDAFEAKDYSSLIRLLGLEGFRLQSHSTKEVINKRINDLISMRSNNSAVKEIIDYCRSQKLIGRSQKIKDFEQSLSEFDADERKIKFYDSLMSVDYREVIEFKRYFDGDKPYSTKHGVKGQEYDNVLVVIDDTAWKQRFNFRELFEGNQRLPKRFKMNQNMFYMCCSRAKKNLAILMLTEMNERGFDTVAEWFEPKNITYLE